MANEITVSLPGLEGEQVFEQVIDAAARQLLQRYVYDEDGDQRAVSSELARRVEDAVVEVIREQAREAAEGVVQKILESKVAVTDRYGYVTDREKPVAEIIAEVVKQEAYHGSGTRGEGAMNKLLRDEVQRAFREELKGEIAKAKAPVLAAVREEATAVFQRAMEKALAAEVSF